MTINKMLIFLYAVSAATHAFCGVVESRTQTAIDGFLEHQFMYNPAMLSSNKKRTSFLAIKDTRGSDVIGSPRNNPQTISYKYKNDIIGLATLFPFGGGAAGLSYIQINNELEVDNSSAGSTFKETKKDDIYAFRFVIELTPSMNFGFHYEYKQAANHIYGAFFINEDDKTNYKAFLSGYRLGINYQRASVGFSLYSAPALRGKALIDGEQKIVTERGSGGAELRFLLSQKLGLGGGITRWFFKTDDRLELSTSPEDQRNISLNGVDFDQYLAPIQNLRVGMRFQAKTNTFFVLNLFQQESVFHFDEDSLPGDDRVNLPSFRYIGATMMFLMKRNKYNFECGFRTIFSREQDSVVDNTGKLGHRNYENYNAEERTIILSLTFTN